MHELSFAGMISGRPMRPALRTVWITLIVVVLSAPALWAQHAQRARHSRHVHHGLIARAAVRSDATTHAVAEVAHGVRMRWTHRAGAHVRYLLRSRQTAPDPTGSAHARGTVDVLTNRVEPDGTAVQTVSMEHSMSTGALARPFDASGLDRALHTARARVRVDVLGHVVSEGGGRSGDAARDAIAANYAWLVPTFPDREVPVGGTWTDRRSSRFELGLGMHLTLQAETTYTLRRVLRGANGRSQLVVGTSQRLSVPQGSDVSGMPIQGTGHADGQCILDPADGSVMYAASRGSIDLEMPSAEVLTHRTSVRFDDELRIAAGRP